MKSASVCNTAVPLLALLFIVGCAAANDPGDSAGGEAGGGAGSSDSGARPRFDGARAGVFAVSPGGESGAAGAAGAAGGESGASGGAGGSSGGWSLGGAGGSGGAAKGPCAAPVFAGVARDFRAWKDGAGHPDMERFTGDGEKGIVLDKLGPDHKPVYAPEEASAMTTGKEAFDQWFRDVDGVNQRFSLDLVPVVDAEGIATYENTAFFPLDGEGFGNELLWHNFHFTFELHMLFVYEGGETFSFGGDDDVWVFVNDRLAIDLGGVHEAQTETLDLDERAAELGIAPGEVYPLDLFMAERHTTESKFRIQSTLAFTNCKPLVY